MLARFVPALEGRAASTQFRGYSVHFDGMISGMAEVKRELIWIQTPFFMGWGCYGRTWRDFISACCTHGHRAVR